MHYPTSEALCEDMRKTQPNVILAFSQGKDSIAAYIQMRRYWENEQIGLLYRYVVPGLSFIEEYMSYFEAKTGAKVVQMPSPQLLNRAVAGTFQTPETMKIVYELGISPVDYYDIESAARIHFNNTRNYQPDTYIGIGVRASDSIHRWRAIKKYGSRRDGQGHFFPVYDWKNERIVSEIKASGIKLPKDYAIWGRSFDGIDLRFIREVKKRFPDDYKKIVNWYPIVEIELYRYEKYGI